MYTNSSIVAHNIRRKASGVALRVTDAPARFAGRALHREPVGGPTHHDTAAGGSTLPRRKRLPWMPAAAVLAVSLVGCSTDRILEVEDRETIDPILTRSPDALPAVHAAAIGEFSVGFTGFPGAGGGSGDNFILQTGLLADEWIASGTFPTRQQIDQRDIRQDNATVQTAFRWYHRARNTAEIAASRFREFEPNSARHAEVANLAGYWYIYFAEAFCSGVPFSSLNEETGEFEFGEPLTTVQMLNRALEWFDEASAAAAEAGSTIQANFSRVGRARALLNLGRSAEAAAEAAFVPTGFQYVVFHSENTTRQNNGVWSFNHSQGRWSLGENEGNNGLPFRSQFTAGDPRTAWTRTPSGVFSVGFDGVTPRVRTLKFPERESPAVVADGVEARLIEAEAALQAGNVGGWLAIHNALRADAAAIMERRVPDFTNLVPEAQTLAPLSDPGLAERVRLHFAERAFWLHLTGHRLGDLRRLMRQYGFGAEQVFPTGAYFKGGSYGPDTHFQVPVDELNNPRFEQCLSRDDTVLHG
jgi:starch-binding outer membrane protein, SusD/RagB family